ncbi:MAG: acyltransferase family protein [Lachnospiraceae bacterium]|jgi:fucose 4-O-acetylase-like acetyltransferase|nr:acyltransferase family protein [Lachnospiraceae bacterium]
MNQPSAPNAASSRSQFWDLVRGIGILSIVMGHSCHPVIPYVYTYHLAVFFFVSGYLYNSKKYGRKPFDHVAAKLKSAWPKYIFYMSVYTLLHNLFQHTGINSPGSLYNHSYTLMALCNAIVFQGVEPMGGTLWFVPVWILACGIFGGIVWFSFRFLPDLSHGPASLRPAAITGISSLFGAAGCFFIFRSLPLAYQLHLAFLVQPFFAAGWLIRCFLPDYRKLLRWYLALPAALVWAFVIRHENLYIDLSLGRIGNGWQFFLLAFLGIYCCMYLATLLEHSKQIKRLVSLWGQYSFDIMAAHFLVFKWIDLIYGRFLVNDPLEQYSGFPQAYAGSLWPAYMILGTTIPALIGLLLEKGGKKLAKHLPA